jgi:S1-C subfamily serine protease
MLAASRLPRAVVVTTFALSGAIATTGITSATIGIGSDSSAPCPHVDADAPAKGILECLEPSTAYLSTPIASGSGLVIDGGYVLTNAHVVDPFSTADVTIGGAKHEAVKVVGVDDFADIAVLGPLDTTATPVRLGDAEDVSALGQGDPLFLIGYPGEANDKDLQVTIADGILSRTRRSREFGLHYLQSDASIGGGQSGGALVGTDGTVLGITSAKLDDSYALALSSDDAAAAVRRILDGKGDAYRAWPGGDPVGSASMTVDGFFRPAQVALPAAPESRQVEITVPADQPLLVQAGSLESDEEGETGANLAAIAAEEAGVPYDVVVASATPAELAQFIPDDVHLAELVRPGTFRFTVPAGSHTFFTVVSFRDGAAEIPVSSTIPFASLEIGTPTDLQVDGDAVRAVAASALPFDLYRVHLAKDQQVRIHAGSPAGDMWVSVTGPGLDEAKDYDDSRTGLYGVDVDETFTAPADGTYELQVGSNDMSSIGYQLSLKTPAEAERTK